MGAVSVGLMLLALVWIIMFRRQAIDSALVASIALFALLANLVSSVNVGLGMLAVLIIGIYVLWDNLRELGR